MAQAEKLALEASVNSFQRGEWRAQRFGWAIWVIVIMLALVGLLGDGPLSSAASSTLDGSLTVEYDRLLRFHSPTLIHLSVRHAGTNGIPIRLKLNQELLDRLFIRRIEPEPVDRELTADGVIYSFAMARERGTILFHVEFQQVGSSRARFEILGQEPIVLHQFVYP